MFCFSIHTNVVVTDHKVCLCPPHFVKYDILSSVVFIQCLFSFASLIEFQNYFCHFLQVSISPLVSVVTANPSLESVPLHDTVFALLFKQPFFLPESMQPLSISSHTWLTLVVECHYTSVILRQLLFWTVA